MSNATDQARSTRSDARAFADAFAGADDAFTFGQDAGESREVTLEELGEVIRLDRATPRSARPASPAPVAVPAPGSSSAAAATPAAAGNDDELLTLDELGEVLARPAREAEILDFDFGTSAHERARRRTAARLDAAPSARRRVSGPSTSSTRPRRADVRLTEVDAPAGERRQAPASSDARAAFADAAASAAERLADPSGVQRFAADRTSASRVEAGSRMPVALRPIEPLVLSDARRSVDVAGAAASGTHSRALDRRPRRSASEVFRENPDRLAMWAVLLGIVLVLIAFTSGSTAAALPLVGLL